jgi:tRNA-Thr(GGU) m(6)t(6)A37 methyltransferase TsaA
LRRKRVHEIEEDPKNQEEKAMICKHASEVPVTKIDKKGFAGMTAKFALTKDDGCPRYAMRLMEFEPGGHTSMHAHPEEHEFYFLEGEPAIVDGSGKETRLRAGDFVYVLPNEPHQIKNVGNTNMKTICTIPILPGGDGKTTTGTANIMESPELKLIGRVRSPLKSRDECPKQTHEGAPDAWIEIAPEFASALEGLTAGQSVLILTWLHEARRDTLRVHPRGNPNVPARGVFATRSPDRPNPIGLHAVRILEIQPPCRVHVKSLEVIDGTPVIDIKPAAPQNGEV